MTGKQIVQKITRIRKEIAGLVALVGDPTEEGLVASAATDDAAYSILLSQAPISITKKKKKS